MRVALFVAAAAISAATPAFLHAQAAGRTRLTVFAGTGATQSLSHPGFDRSMGPSFVGGIELARPAAAGLAGRLALGAEGGFSSQGLDVNSDVVSGNVHTVHAALALRAALVARGAGTRRLVPYAVAGAAWARPSTRVALNEDPQATPGARFEQVTHETAAGAILGAGVAWAMQRAAIRAEARWMMLRTSENATSTLPMLVTIAVPLRR